MTTLDEKVKDHGLNEPFKDEGELKRLLEDEWRQVKGQYGLKLAPQEERFLRALWQQSPAIMSNYSLIGAMWGKGDGKYGRAEILKTYVCLVKNKIGESSAKGILQIYGIRCMGRWLEINTPDGHKLLKRLRSTPLHETGNPYALSQVAALNGIHLEPQGAKKFYEMLKKALSQEAKPLRIPEDPDAYQVLKIEMWALRNAINGKVINGYSYEIVYKQGYLAKIREVHALGCAA